MKTPSLLLLLIACGPCLAQTPSANTMPDGSKDRYIGIAVAILPSYEGSNQTNARFAVEGQMDWSNGIFVTNLPRMYEQTYAQTFFQLGRHLSETPGIDYGPVVTLSRSRPTFLSHRTVDVGDSVDMGAVGGFFKYNLTDELQLTTDLSIYTGRFRGGALADLDVRKYTRVAPHQSIALWSGLTWGNRDFSQSQYGVTPDQSLNSGFPVYSPTAGVEDVHLGLNWRWEISSSWMMNSGVYATHLTGSVAGSPQIAQPNNVSVSIGLVYRL
jgi:outer membrane protein